LFCKKYFLRHKFQLLLYIAATIITTAIGIASPYIIGDFLDALVSGANFNAIIWFCVIFGGLNVFKIIKGYVTSIVYVKMQAQMSYELNSDTIKHVQNLSLTYVNQNDSAYLSQRINNDSSTVIVFGITILQSVLTNALTLVVPFAILLSMNWRITLLFVGFLVAYTAIYLIFKKYLYNAYLVFMEASNKFFSSLYEQLRYIKSIKINSIQPEINKRADKSFESLQNTTIHRQKLNYMYSSSENVVATIAQITLFVVGGIQFINGNFTIGMFTVFTSFFNMMMSAGKYFLGLGASYQNVLVAYNRLLEIIEYSRESNGDKTLSDISIISFNNVCFTYDAAQQDRHILHNFSKTFEKGKIYAICGENGSGKTTLVNLILGLYIDEFQGSITYNGIDIKAVDVKNARRHLIAFAEQEPMLLNDSIVYNITYDTDFAIEVNRLDKYINVLNMQEFIREKSFDYKIDDRNSNTSGGEKQKIAILKTLYRDTPIMVFDEPTSALDAQTSKQFVDYLLTIKKDKIIIIITHDSSIKKLCDETIDLL